MLFSDPSAQNDLKMAQSDLALSQKLSKELQDYQSMVVEDYQTMVVARQASLILLPGQPALLRHVRRVLPAAGGSRCMSRGSSWTRIGGLGCQITSATFFFADRFWE